MRYKGEFLGWMHSGERDKSLMRGSNAMAGGGLARGGCLLLPSAACGGAGPDPQQLFHPPQCWHGIFWGKAHKPKASPPLVMSSKEAGWGLAAWPQAGSCSSWGGCGRRAGLRATGKWLAGAWQPPMRGRGRRRGCQGAAFLVRKRRSCRSQPTAESSLFHC